MEIGTSPNFNPPQHIRVLANEMLATRLGLALGLPMPQVVVIEVSDAMIEHAEDLRTTRDGQAIPCRPGKQLESPCVRCPGMRLAYLPASSSRWVVRSCSFPTENIAS